MREAQLDWRAREPPGTVLSLGETRALSLRGSAGCSVPLSTEGVRTGGRIPAWARLVGSHLQELAEGRRVLRVDICNDDIYFVRNCCVYPGLIQTQARPLFQIWIIIS